MQYSEELVIEGTAFDVPTDNYEDFNQELDQSKLGDRLIQKNPLKGSRREYQYYDARFLILNFIDSKNSKVKKFRVNLACLSSTVEHNKVIIWKWLYSAIAAGFLALISAYIATLQTVKLEYSLVAGSITLTTAIIFLLTFIYQKRDEYIFKSRFGGARLFLVENGKPDDKTFKAFYENLKQTIERLQSNLPVSECLVDELKMCRHLRDMNIIDDDTYTRARTAIFKHEQYGSQ